MIDDKWDDYTIPSDDEFTMGLDSWIGGTPVLIGLSRGYNDDYSLNLNIKYISADSDRIRALNEGRIHATEMSLPSFMRFQEKYPDSAVIVGITDFSRGADGIVAKSEVKDLNDIEGRRVSYVANGTGKFILNKFLRLVGLRYQDIEPVERENMSEVIEDLKSGYSDLIVSWSPDMNIAVNEINAKKPDSVKVLINTKEVPDLVPTMLVVNRGYAERNPEMVENFLRTWFAASKYIIEKPDRAYEKLAELMSENEEYGPVSKEEVEASFKDIKLMSLNENLEYFGINRGENRIESIINDTVETWKRYGDMSKGFVPSDDVFSAGYLEKLNNDEELLVGVVDTGTSENNPQSEGQKKEFKEQNEQSIEQNTERVAKVDIPPVYYDSGKATVKAESLPVLDEVLDILSQFPEYYLIVDAHTDSVGSDESNLKLSKDRALEVKKYLVQNGVDENRIVARGWGEYRPIVANELTEEDRAKNRRTEFILTREIQN
ncbi:phosphate ABC transporter substrate-binding/OmpA family protein [Acetivibrio straminisolvens]|uniref:Outer membrane protein A n=2 Tax=Acetivibrio straminisolvens TaxID=253314 RepID=W4VC34_9FIRM|nr:phosphate ABC transporter substrate-binding/OmpA family protein [Acetivibrio straminisolvens]GAE90353.1 outer membrane protein A precursor [Acetivibrio straminisolvens JCM 21531]